MIRRELSADTETPVSLFMAARGDDTHAALYESVEGQERWARKSLIALGCRTEVVAHTLAEVPRVLALAQAAPASPLDYAFGWFAYEAAQAFTPVTGGLLPPPPLAEFFVPEAVLLYDHRAHSVEAFFADDAIERRVMERLSRAPRAPLSDLAARPAPVVASRQVAPREYERKVLRAKDYIAAGDAFQIVVSQKFHLPAGPRDLFGAYRALRRDNPSPYLYYFKTPHVEAAGASPETLIRVEDDVVRVRPIAGTRGRGRDEHEDRAIEQELLSDEKERAEHLMLIDLGRNDVGRVAEPGSVAVDPMMVVERYSHVMHIVSEVQGKLRQECSALDAFAAAFPAGTLSGAPKRRAMEIIAELEETPRGLYGGAVGYFASRRACDFAIAIRTLWRTRPDGACTVQAGAGIVYDSDPRAEQQECERKAASPLHGCNAVLDEGIGPVGEPT